MTTSSSLGVALSASSIARASSTPKTSDQYRQYMNRESHKKEGGVLPGSVSMIILCLGAMMKNPLGIYLLDLISVNLGEKGQSEDNIGRNGRVQEVCL
jgi:Na+/proline symporter